ncbi:CaiB/BaiF CoA transferase family protein [Paraburkholderia bannensis]|uniref:CaiB/BaiF CoA transferase family protein n=1 Tax=Paraburkholderia bannensis TaxID=765414 RepID=UPI002AB2D80C|nr:CaiB/BaiF CoA-transferase family protein [Paraburkholderia bannensis]
MQDIKKSFPLLDVRVLDLSRGLVEPRIAKALSDLGAEVIEVRHHSHADGTKEHIARKGEMGSTLLKGVGSRTRSISLNLQTPAGAQIALDLAKSSDVVIEDRTTDGEADVRLGHKQLRGVNQRLVYCSVMSVMACDTEEMLREYGSVVDFFVSMHAAQTIVAALYERERTGLGRHIEMALFEFGVIFAANCGLEALAIGGATTQYGNVHSSIVPYGMFDTADGPVVISINDDSQFQRFCEVVIERPDLAVDPRYESSALRSRNREALLLVGAAELSRRPRTDILARLVRADIPCGEVATLPAALLPDRVAKQARTCQRGRTNQSDDTFEVLRSELGLSDERLDKMKGLGVICRGIELIG